MKRKVNMKKIKLICFGLFLGLLVGCGTTAVAEQNNALKIWFQNENGSVSTYNVVDDNTGVNYVVVSQYVEAYGNITTSISVCPRYNADGTLYTSK